MQSILWNRKGFAIIFFRNESKHFKCSKLTKMLASIYFCITSLYFFWMGIFNSHSKNTNQTSIWEETSAIPPYFKKSNCWKNINFTWRFQFMSVVYVIENGKKLCYFCRCYLQLVCTMIENISSFLKTENWKSYATNSTGIQKDFEKIFSIDNFYQSISKMPTKIWGKVSSEVLTSTPPYTI